MTVEKLKAFICVKKDGSEAGVASAVTRLGAATMIATTDEQFKAMRKIAQDMVQAIYEEEKNLVGDLKSEIRIVEFERAVVLEKVEPQRVVLSEKIENGGKIGGVDGGKIGM